MKTITTAMALMLLLLLPFGASAQITEGGLFNTDFFNDQTERQGLLENRDVVFSWSLTNQSFGEPAPLGSGLAILFAAGAGYAVVRRKRSRKNMTILIALVALLGFTQCKKEEPQEPANNGNTVRITLNVGGNGGKGTRADVNTGTGAVTYENGDKILVASNGHYIGTLNHNGTSFSGTITDPVEGQPLYFYFLGNKIDGSTLTPGASGSTSCTVNISDQTSKLPVISMAPSTENYSSSISAYSAKLLNKCSLMKFNVTTPSTSPICITGMNNKVTIDFSKAANDGASNGFSYSVDSEDGGLIKMAAKGGNNATWAIVLPQDALSAGSVGTAYTTDNIYEGTRPSLSAISANQYLNTGVAMTVNTYTELGTPLTFEATTSGTTVTFTKAPTLPDLSIEYRKNSGAWTTYTSAISLNSGEKVSFRGNNAAYATNVFSGYYSTFSCNKDCYIYGNIMSLISSTDYANAKTLSANLTFAFLF